MINGVRFISLHFRRRSIDRIRSASFRPMRRLEIAGIAARGSASRERAARRASARSGTDDLAEITFTRGR
jgi:hypothetical protein